MVDRTAEAGSLPSRGSRSCWWEAKSMRGPLRARGSGAGTVGERPVRRGGRAGGMRPGAPCKRRSPVKGAPNVVRSAGRGAWSGRATGEGGKVPGGGARVQVRSGHRVVYDVNAAHAVRLLHVAGVLPFAPDRDTRLDVGLIKVQA